MRTKAWIIAVAAMALSLFASTSSAQDNYPTHPVRVIAASAAGGNPDVLARILSARLSDIFNNPFVVEDVPGVGGVIAAKQTAAARPDGARQREAVGAVGVEDELAVAGVVADQLEGVAAEAARDIARDRRALGGVGAVAGRRAVR